ncbi:His-Xaa-Ser system radical SAM maturase HxsB [Candidatus Woesearchaeota archaeon]|nr:His-Xaa-Ser system radical SAM maturase HxsB [Candidatus Woesearchaeota archaeon]
MQFINGRKILSDYKLNNIKTKKIRDRILIVTDSGSWAALKREEYAKLMGHTLTEELYLNLEEKGIILTKNNFDMIVDSYKRKKRQLFQGTSLHIIVVTLRCNMACVYCHSASKHISKKEYDMDKITAQKTVEFIFQAPSNALTIEFQGGEPLVNFDIVKFIINYAKKLNSEYKKDLRFSIVTNLTLMNDEILKFLEDNKVGICTSLDGPKIVHDFNRKLLNRGSSYPDVIKWIKAIKKRNKIGINALMVTTKNSLKYPMEIIDAYQSLKLSRLWIRFLNNLGYALNIWKKISYSPEEYLEFWKKIIDYVYLQDNIIEVSSLYMLLKIMTKEDPMYLDLMSPCGAAIGQLAYQFNGSIYSCDEGRMVGEEIFKLGTVFENSYREVLCSEKTCSLISSSVNDACLCNSCTYQPYCGLCPVNCYMSTGNLIPKLATDFRCRILKGQFDYLFEKIIFDTKFNENLKKGKLKTPYKL